MTTTVPVVRIGGIIVADPKCPVPSGLAPGGTAVSLYQIDVLVPNTGPGLQPITVTIGDVGQFRDD